MSMAPAPASRRADICLSPDPSLIQKVLNKHTGVGQATWCFLASAPVFWSMAKERIVEESWFATSNISLPTNAISRGVRPPVVTCWGVKGAPSSDLMK